MQKSHLFLIVILLLLPAALSQDCTTALQSDCGATGSTCQYFKWNNGSCVAPASCPTSPTFTVWSNSSNNCIICSQADMDVCMLCTGYNFFFNSQKSLCTACSTAYGSLCATCDASGCLTCSDPTYSVTANNQSCALPGCNVEYCIDCVNATFCRTCDSLHTIFNGVCICSLANCKICDAGLCSKCQDGYALDSSGTKCNIICISNCDVCSDLNSCSTCALGYRYDSSVNQCRLDCSAIDANCISCTTRTKCGSCSAAYNVNLAGNACILKCTDTNCIECSPANNCQTCTTGYFRLQNATTSLYYCSADICEIRFCANCATTSTCRTCISLYKLNEGRTTCIPDCGIENCASCATTTTCANCIDGYRVQSNACVQICTISNCRLCASSTTCLSCSDGFVLSANNQACSFNCRIEGCVTCASTTTCSLCFDGSTLNTARTACVVQCTDGFYREDNKCKACPNNCLICDSVGKCLSCVSLYYLDTADSFTCKKCSTIDNCYDCEASQAVCKTCVSGYSLISSVCVDNTKCAVTDCKVCVANNNFACQTCESGYSVNVNNTCSAIVCTGGQYLVGSTCSCGPKLYFLNGACVGCNSNCLVCSTTACTSCIQEYYPSGTSCIRCGSNCQACDSTGCTKCRDRFVIVSGACQPPTSVKVTSVANTGDPIICPTGCRVCDLDSNGNTVCRSASDGYVLVSGKIFKCASSCLTCSPVLNTVTNQYSNCLTCPTGSNFNAGSCSRCTDRNALTCRTSNAAYSLTCKPGFNAEGGQCKACDSNCLKCGVNKAGSCDLNGCVTGYYQSKDSYICVKCFGGCLVCDTDPNVCLKCGDYRYLLNNVCQNCGSNCVSCINATVCSTCDTGYLPATDGTCKSLDIDYCVSYDASLACSKCDSNYVLAANKLSCSLNLGCNSTATCSSCKSGFFLTNGTCLSCPTIANCSYCDQYDSTKCASCVAGYFSSSGTCTKCTQTGCATCLSEFVCTSAQSGYFLAVDISGALTGDVGQCGGQCATCILSELTCLTCVAGASQTGTSCLKNNNIVLTIVASLLNLLAGASSEFQFGQGLSKYPRFLKELGINTLNFPSFYDFQANSRVNKVTSGSVVTEIAVNSDAVSGDANKLMQTASFSDFAVVSHSIVTNSDSSSSVNLGLVLGVSIPLGVLLIAIIIILKVKSDKVDEESGLDGTQKDIEYQVEQF